MGRFRPSSSYGHGVECLSAFHGEYRLHWTVDRYINGSRQRWPTKGRRDTDKAGAERFCKKWGCKMPERGVGG
jgi:hypothetical protein